MGMPRTIAYAMRNRARALGLEVTRVHRPDIERPSPAESLIALHLAHVFERFKIATVVDVGARYGEFGRFLRSNGYRGRIVSFEPVGSNFDVLNAVVAADSKWAAHQLALSDSSGVRIINVARQSSASSFLAPSPASIKNFGAESEVSYTEEVSTRTLMDVWSDTVGSPATECFLKIDTQGWDLNVLRGAGTIVDSLPALQIEATFQPLYEGVPTFVDSMNSVLDRGFRVSGLFPVVLDRDMAVIDLDCVFIRPTNG